MTVTENYNAYTRAHKAKRKLQLDIFDSGGNYKFMYDHYVRKREEGGGDSATDARNNESAAASGDGDGGRTSAVTHACIDRSSGGTPIVRRGVRLP